MPKGWFLLSSGVLGVLGGVSVLSEGLAAQSKAKAIGQNKISSANQRPAFQIIFFFLFGPV